MVRKLIDWLTLKDYDLAKHEGTMRVIARYSRGNVAVQNGWLMDDARLQELSAAGDKAMESLEQRLPAE